MYVMIEARETLGWNGSSVGNVLALEAWGPEFRPPKKLDVDVFSVTLALGGDEVRKGQIAEATLTSQCA